MTQTRIKKLSRLLHKRSIISSSSKSQQLIAVIVIVLVAGIGTYLLTASHAASPYASVTADTGNVAGGATKLAVTGSTDGTAVQFGTLSGGGGSTNNNCPGITDAAFCDNFNNPTNNNPASAREGQLNSNVWGASRWTGNQNFGSSAFDWASAQLSSCGSNALVNPPQDIQICNGQVHETVNDGGTVTVLAMYPKQPFDFSAATPSAPGKIVYDVSDDSEGSHAAWPEFWMSDQPLPDPFTHEEDDSNTLPRNGFGIRFAAAVDPNTGNGQDCEGVPPCTVTVDSAIVVNNYIPNDTGPTIRTNGPLTVNVMGAVTQPSPGQLNHFEIDISSSNQIDVYGTNAFSGTWNPSADPLVHLASIPNAGLTFTRGLVWMEDAHYNANKFNNQRLNSFTWDNLGFNGPVLPRDIGYDVADADIPDDSTQAGSGVPATDLGYYVPPNSSLSETVSGVTSANISAASGALLVYNFFDATEPMPISVSVNGHSVSEAWPFPTSTDYGGNNSRSLAIQVPLSDIVSGNNTVTWTAGADGYNVGNISLIMQGAAGVPNPNVSPD